VVPEELRAFVDRHGRTPTQHEQWDIMHTQQGLEDRTAATCAHGVVIADPAALVTAVYSLMYFDDDALLDEAVDSATRYDLVIWCDIDVPWVPDGLQRDGPDFRDREHALIGRIVEERLIPRGIDVVKVSGSADERLAAARRAWQRRGSNAPT
jgi:nicotinamide riboside kinase